MPAPELQIRKARKRLWPGPIHGRIWQASQQLDTLNRVTPKPPNTATRRHGERLPLQAPGALL
jgi:hypothetical protein